jgi:hypothetical protein
VFLLLDGVEFGFWRREEVGGVREREEVGEEGAEGGFLAEAGGGVGSGREKTACGICWGGDLLVREGERARGGEEEKEEGAGA